MTSLFFIMLVLFVLVFSIMKRELQENVKIANNLKDQLTINDSIRTQLTLQLIQNEEVTNELRNSQNLLLARADEVAKIRSINQALRALERSGLYLFNDNCKRFELKQEVLFVKNSAVYNTPRY